MTTPSRRPGTALTGAGSELAAPRLARWRHLFHYSAPPPDPGRLRVTFFGVSTLLLDDGRNAVLTDGFFTRPGLLRAALGRMQPHLGRIQHHLTAAGVDQLDAVFVVHSHLDHALDAPVVAQLTGATLLGSASTGNIARGYGFPRSSFHAVRTGEPMDFGAFRLTALPALHSPGDRFPGHIDQPLPPPARTAEYKTGDCYSLHVSHPDGNILIHASANYLPGALTGISADTVYLGIGALGKQSETFRRQYWKETVTTIGAGCVQPIHWDNFTRSLRRPLRPLPTVFDNFTTTMNFLTERAAAEQIMLRLPVFGAPADPFPNP